MLGTTLSHDPEAPCRLLCLGAHADDIEIGCGGTLLKLLRRYPQAVVHWVVFSGAPGRRDEALRSAEAFLSGVREKTVRVHTFRDGHFPFEGAAIKAQFEALKGAFTPDVVFTHYREDRHQDHRLISDLTWNTFRDHLVLEYEIPKFDGDLGRPNAYVALDEALRAAKVQHLMTHFASQRAKPWYTEDTFHALLRLRGIECGAAHAEAFHARKMRLFDAAGHLATKATPAPFTTLTSAPM